jgi:hypothetical protein
VTETAFDSAVIFLAPLFATKAMFRVFAIAFFRKTHTNLGIATAARSPISGVANPYDVVVE